MAEKSGSIPRGFEVLVKKASVDPEFNDAKNRPVLAQTSEDNNGERFTVAVNHLKSKGSDCDDVGDPNLNDGQGNCNLTRTKAATALVNWLATDPTDEQADQGDTDQRRHELQSCRLVYLAHLPKGVR